MKTDKIFSNKEIKAFRVLVIGSDGAKRGEFLKEDAIKLAESENLDLVQVSNDEKPVCKIMDLGKFIYDQKKREKQNHSHAIKTKEIRINFQSDDNYVSLRAKQARDFIKDGHKVLITLKFKGRESYHSNLIKAKCLDICTKLEDIAVMESPPSFGNGQVSVMLIRK